MNADTPGSHSAPAGDPGGAASTSGSPPDVGALRRQAVGGSVWTFLGFGAGNAMRLVSNVLLARLLFPEAFGLMAIVHVFIQGLWLFTDIGIGPAIVQSRRGEDPAFLDTAWTIQVLRGFALCLASFVLAWPVATLYGRTDPLAADLLYYVPVTGLTAILDGAVSTRLHLYARNLRVKELTLFDVSTQALALLTTVGAAWIYPSIWALVFGALAKSAIRVVVSHLVFGDRVMNRPRWDPDAARALFQFGKWVAVSTVLTFLASQADRLLFGALVPWSVLGVYGIAATLAAVPLGALLSVGNKILFPVLSRLRDQRGSQLREAERARLAVLIVGGGIISAVIPGGPALIELFYDHRYAGAAWMLQVLVVGAWFQVIENPNTSLLLARGETREVAAGNLVRLVGILVLVPAGFSARGFEGALLGLVVADVGKYLTTAVLVRRRGLRVLRVDTAATLLVILSAVLGASAARATSGHPVLTLLLGSGVGAAPWVVAAAIFYVRVRASLAPPAPAPA